jgi:hypothetical protein
VPAVFPATAATIPVIVPVCALPVLVAVKFPEPPDTKVPKVAFADPEATVSGSAMVLALDGVTLPDKIKSLLASAFVTVHVTPSLQVAVTVEVCVVFAAWFKVLNAIGLADTVHVPTTLPEAVIDPLAVEEAKVLFAVNKSNAELISNNFFNLFIFFYISCLKNIN